MNKYEGMFLLDTSRSAKDWDKVVAHVQDILTKNGAQIETCEKWAERKLAYEIGHHRRAVYLLVIFLCPGAAIGRIKRACQLSDAIIRVLITVFDEKARVAVEPEEAATPSRAGKETAGEPAKEEVAGPPAKAEAEESEEKEAETAEEAEEPSASPETSEEAPPEEKRGDEEKE